MSSPFVSALLGAGRAAVGTAGALFLRRFVATPVVAPAPLQGGAMFHVVGSF